MGATAKLLQRDLTVEPGGEAVLQIQVSNTGRQVDEFTLEVLGDAAPWSEVGPAVLKLLPAGEEAAEVRFRPPRLHSTSAKSVPFAVRIRSKEDPEGSTVEEGVLRVSPFRNTYAEIVPHTARGSRSARYDLAMDNRGNARVDATVTPSEANNTVTFEVSPPELNAEPGTAAFAAVRVKPKKRFWRGQPKTIPFQVSVHAQGETPVRLDAAYMQDPLTPKWLPAALGALVAAVVALALLWFLVLKPNVESTAKDAVKQPLAQQAAAVAANKKAVDALQQQVASGSGSAPAQAPAGPAASSGNSLGSPTYGRLTNYGATSYTVASGGTLSVTDLVFENPNNETSGTITLESVDSGGTHELFTLSMQNFRDLDYHFVSPITLQAGDKLQIVTSPGSSHASVYFSGYLKTS